MFLRFSLAFSKRPRTRKKGFGTFPHTFTLFQSFQNFTSRTFLRIKGFFYCFSSKRRKENKREQQEKDRTMLHVSCCTFVLLRGIATLPKKELKDRFVGPDIFRWAGGLAREGVGGQKCGMSIHTSTSAGRPLRIFSGSYLTFSLARQ